jgi:hypothetical protein
MSWLKDDKEMQRDRAHSMKVYCMSSPPVQLLGAPKPVGEQRGAHVVPDDPAVEVTAV